MRTTIRTAACGSTGSQAAPRRCLTARASTYLLTCRLPSIATQERSTATLSSERSASTTRASMTAPSPTAPHALPTTTSATMCFQASATTYAHCTSLNGHAVACGIHATLRRGHPVCRQCSWSCCRTKTSPTCAMASTHGSISP